MSRFNEVIFTLKEILKQRKITYRSLAETLKLSESGVKKIFTGTDCSFGRLESICDVLGTTLAEVMEQADKWQSRVIELDEDVQQEFLADELLFKVFWFLIYERMSTTDLASHLELSREDLRYYLLRLDNLGLIEWNREERVNFSKDGLLLFKDKGPFLEKIKLAWSNRLLNESLKSRRGFRLRYFRLTDENAEIFRKRLTELVKEFDLQTKRDLSLHGPGGAHGHRFIACFEAGSFVE